ncbi:hypothetical protein V8F06_004430 [Rhypophila decipiens]
MLFALGQKRFRVNYGLAPDRKPPTMLAVPYRAKDMPSPRSEFSHPDAVIVLTSLSYYYRGLSDAELYNCLDLLGKSDQGDEEYGRWAFPLKLSASGWDLAKCKQQPLTGFSGTNDSKGVLPLSVTALDLQPHTNAGVMSTILQPENAVLELGGGNTAQVSALTEEMLLDALHKSSTPMRVILDVGAQIIESSNIQMARKLLNTVPVGDVDAVIFFDDRDELSVLTRNGFVNPFLTSPFAIHTDRCLVFLDQAHTRGTDLKLPDHYRAAVTLGPGVTKDTLVQACMRMRKLGQGQSVTFIVSPEMQKRIRGIRNITNGRSLAVSDIIAWSVWETWNEEERSIPLWANQGLRHIRQETIWEDANSSGSFSSTHAHRYLETEAMSLEERYRPKAAAGSEDTNLPNRNEVGSSLVSQLSKIEEALTDFGDSTSGSSPTSSMIQEEQERELAPEIEQERQVSRPAPRKALHHDNHPDLLTFVRTGQIPTNSDCFLPAFAAMSNTTAASLFPGDLSSFLGNLLVTKDFTRTVDETGPNYHSDSYQRDVQWILVTNSGTAGPGEKTPISRMVIISPFEANHVKNVIEKQDDPVPVTLHAYLPRPSLTFRSMEDLDTYIAYLRSYDEYVRLCRYLGLMYAASGGKEVRTVDGFVGKRGYPDECEFDSNPVPFLSEMYKKIRRDCVSGFEKTHLGRILAGEILKERGFDV